MRKKAVITFLVVLSFLSSSWLPCKAETTAPDVSSMQSASPKISVSPKSVNCGKVKAGDLSVCKAVTVKNTGTGQLIVNSLSITGLNASEFNQTNGCTVLETGGSCTIHVIFSPQVPFGKKAAILNISSNDPKKPNVAVKLSGQAPPPVIAVSPKSVNCGSVKVGSTSAKAVTIKNTGTSDLVISSITITGTNAGEFSRTHDCSVLKKGGTCSVSVAFTPALVGKKSAMLSIASNAPKKPVVNVKLSAKGLVSGSGGSRATVNTWTAEKAIGMAILGQQIGDFGQG